MGMLFKPFHCGPYLPDCPCYSGLIVFRYFCPDLEDSLLCQQRPCWLHQPARLFVFAGLTAFDGFLFRSTSSEANSSSISWPEIVIPARACL